MILTDELTKRIRFQLCSQFSEPLRIEGFGKMYSFRVDTEEDLMSYPESG